jgi:GNAT superfamily N-acetyltransferase
VIRELLKVEADREFQLDLRRPLVPWAPPPDVTIALASPEQVAEIARLRGQEAVEDLDELYRARLQRGQKCFVALIGGTVVGCNWLCLAAEPDGSVTFVPPSGEVVCTDAYTAVAQRGRSIHTALLHAMLVWAQQAGYVRAYTYVALGNTRSSKAHTLLQWQISRWPRYIVLSSPRLCRTGWCYEVVVELRRGPPLAPGRLLRRLPIGDRADAC